MLLCWLLGSGVLPATIFIIISLSLHKGSLIIILPFTTVSQLEKVNMESGLESIPYQGFYQEIWIVYHQNK